MCSFKENISAGISLQATLSWESVNDVKTIIYKTRDMINKNTSTCMQLYEWISAIRCRDYILTTMALPFTYITIEGFSGSTWQIAQLLYVSKSKLARTMLRASCKCSCCAMFIPVQLLDIHTGSYQRELACQLGLLQLTMNQVVQLGGWNYSCDLHKMCTYNKDYSVVVWFNAWLNHSNEQHGW